MISWLDIKGTSENVLFFYLMPDKVCAFLYDHRGKANDNKSRLFMLII
ncbi:conserved hypothetical protein [Xenorhabdus nematophila F1]|uniref:Uncharacterized protein n=1 Tax=Xenorhabdus nematophila (strain ATCC 19061 / DSM 3370 / CCUG 14189 / LMG 1036 / NCIMB 9965 / AN6) TaxID=406817 RepID=D3VD36_XENNA|nr:hypothetical protein XNC1_1842 [Xenorhabdus nematophila ATCC 19061]CCW30041.1 conserved hypothetical protein [Xenorhabdus nematophila F1]CEK22781.1 hypothetical protein XNC2_1787 [Xenorhabdus nematophila AN6/1]